jgi:hypothetical protein
MIEEVFNISNWKILSMGKGLELTQKNKEDTTVKIHMWRNSSQELSPFATYKLLKAKFGEPNGYMMALKNNHADNLIHWHYSFISNEFIINFIGKTSIMEVGITLPKGFRFYKKYWEILVGNIKNSFTSYGQEMNLVQSKMEHWMLFINPFCRIHYSLQELLNEIEILDLKEVEEYNIKSSKKELDRYCIF